MALSVALGLPTAIARASMWPDEWVGWVPAAVWHGVRAVKKYRPRVIFSTSPMVTAHLAALIVHRMTGVPWVADFRDGWALDPGPAWSSVAPPRRIMRSVRAAVRVRCDLYDRGLRQHRRVDLDRDDPRRVLIPNGVDLADRRWRRMLPSRPPEDRFRLSYVGALYGSRNAAPVFAAAKQLIARGRPGPGAASRSALSALRARSGGRGAGRLVHRLRGAHVRPSARCAARQRSSSISRPSRWERRARSSSTSCQVGPSSASAHPDNVAYRLVQELGAGECADVRDPASVETALERLVEKWKSGTLTLPDEVRAEALRRFSREKLAGDLAQLFRSVTAPVATA